MKSLDFIRRQLSVSRLARICIGVVLLMAATYKLSNPESFQTAVRSYGLPLGEQLTWLISVWFPGVELVLGICLVAGFAQAEAAFLSAVLFGCFAGLSVYEWGYNLSIPDCGCFGGERSWWTHGLGKFVRNVAFFGIAYLGLHRTAKLCSPPCLLHEVGQGDSPRRIESQSAFTLIELLVALSIIGVLGALLLPAISRSKEKVRKSACVSNLRQLVVASLLYGDNDEDGAFSPSVDRDDVDLNHLLPEIESRRVFVCPSTKNNVSDEPGENPLCGRQGLKDLIRPAANAHMESGTSYLLYSFMGLGATSSVPTCEGLRRLPYAKKTTRTILTHRHLNDVLGLVGLETGPSRIWLLLDSNWSGVNGFPDALDNHGTAGGNIGFCDGHVEWVSQQDYVYSFEMSQDRGRTEPILPGYQ